MIKACCSLPEEHKYSDMSLDSMTLLSLLLVQFVSPDVMYNGLPWPEEEFSKVNILFEFMGQDFIDKLVLFMMWKFIANLNRKENNNRNNNIVYFDMTNMRYETSNKLWNSLANMIWNLVCHINIVNCLNTILYEKRYCEYLILTYKQVTIKLKVIASTNNTIFKLVSALM